MLRVGLFGGIRAPEPSEAVNGLFPQGYVIGGVFHDHSGNIRKPDLRPFGEHCPPILRPFGEHIQVVEEQVVEEQVVGATILWINSLKKNDPKRQNQTFLIGKELKTKDLRQTAAERGKRITPKTRIKPPDSLCREASQAAGAAPTLRSRSLLSPLVTPCHPKSYRTRKRTPLCSPKGLRNVHFSASQVVGVTLG